MNYTSRERFPAGQEPEDDTPIGIVSLWRLLWRNKWRIAAPAFALAFVTGLLMLQAEDSYTAEAQMLLSRGNLEIVEFDSAAVAEVTQAALSNALTILGSRSVAQQVVERLDLTNDPEVNPNLALPEDADPEDFYPEAAVRQYALDWLAETVQIGLLPGSNAISIRATSTAPEKSAAIANAYVEAYLDYQLRRGQNETERAATALETRVNELRLQLEEDRERLQDYRAGMSATVLDSADDMAGEVANMRARLETNAEALRALDRAETALNGVPAGDADALRQVIDETPALARLAPSTLGEAVAPGTMAEDRAALADALAAERARLMRLQDALTEGQTALQSRLAELNAFAVGLRQLEVEVDTTAQVYESSLARLKELSIQTGLRDAGAQVLAQAEAPLRSDARGRRRMVAIAGVLGLFAGIAWVLLREAANDRVRRVSDLIEITGAESVVQLPAARPGIFGMPKKLGPFLEGIRALRHRLTPGGAMQNASLVAGVFSALPTEGKTTVLRALAQSYAMVGRRVIVLDGDMRVGRLTGELGIAAGSPGLSEVLSEDLDPSEAIVTFEEGGFDVLPSGRPNAHSADLLESRRFGELVAALRERYDVVLVESPPVLVLPDAPKIAAHMNTMVLVTEYDRTPRPAVRDAVAALRAEKKDRPVVALCNAPKAFGQPYWMPQTASARYWG